MENVDRVSVKGVFFNLFVIGLSEESFIQEVNNIKGNKDNSANDLGKKKRLVSKWEMTKINTKLANFREMLETWSFKLKIKKNDRFEWINFFTSSKT